MYHFLIDLLYVSLLFFSFWHNVSLGTDASLEKITSDFVRIEDANFALFNYVTEMNNQVDRETESGDRRDNKGEIL